MKTNKTRLFGTLLALMAGASQGAWAQANVTTADALYDAVTKNQTVTLGQDITLRTDGRLHIDGKTVTLDLNGHTLTRPMTAADAGGQVIAVMNGGKLTITDSSGSNSGKITGGWSYQGSGIYVYENCELTINGGTITGNRSDKIEGEGTNYGYGGGVENHGTMTITGGNITGNTAGQFGGGIHNEGTLTITGGTIADNTAGTYGGAIYSNRTVAISGATLCGNTAQLGGGAICSEGTLTLDGVTITGNSSDNYGGGIYMFKSAASPGIVQLQGVCTITGNTAQAGSGIFQVTNGAGVDGPTLKMQDKPVVDNNTNDNVYLQSYQLITLTGAFETGARVGVCCEDLGQETFTRGYVDHNDAADPSTFFFFSSPTVNGVVNKVGREVGFTIKGYNYVECSWDGGKVTETEKNLSLSWQTVHVLSGDNTANGEWLPLEGGHYYIVTANAEYTALQVQNCLNTSGAHLILCNGTQLKVNNGVKVEAGNTLHIHGQPGNTGQLIATNEEYEAAAIGSGDAADAGTIYFHGGTITATSRHGSGAAGIGGGYEHAGGNIYIYGGDITATSAYHAPGIGSGGDCPAASAGNVYIYGGNITAVAGVNAAGIGGGNDGAGPIVRIYGGDVTATGGQGGAGIGSGGKSGSNDSSWGDIAIYGGTVHANGGAKASGGTGIGGGDNCFRGTVNIQGGTVYADGYNTDFAIGCGSMDYGGQFSSSGNITISGGTVYAKSHGSSGNTSFGGSAIGGDGGTKVAITGGEIHAFFGNKTACIPIKIANSSLLTLGDNMTVYVGDNQRQDANGRVEALLSSHDGYALIRPCDHTNKTVSSFDDEYHYFSCSYCLTTPADNKEEHSFNDNDICEICGRNLTLTLYDNSSNSSTLQTYNGKSADAITLSGRTLYKGGMWNTLCLPFDVEIETSPLVGATAKYLNNATFDEGTLTLEFKDVVSYTSGGSTHTYLQAGTPYFIKWTTVGDPIQNPKFSYCFLASTEPTDITFDGVLTFRGIYDPQNISSENKTMLYLGADNKLYYPNAAMTIGAFRAYFELADGLTAGDPASGIRTFVLNFDGEETGIREINASNPSNASNAWFSLDGQRLSGKPAQRGLYLNRGRKVLIK